MEVLRELTDQHLLNIRNLKKMLKQYEDQQEIIEKFNSLKVDNDRNKWSNVFTNKRRFQRLYLHPRRLELIQISL